ncbi:MAG: hypothetical protein Q8L23_16360 [Caulobacter sp.]|nr:hypothetical protein [Caulobacter sp.]
MTTVVNAANLVFCLALGALTGFLATLDYSRECPADDIISLPAVFLVAPFAISGASSALALLRFFGPTRRSVVIALGLAACLSSLVVLVSQAFQLGAPTAYVVGLTFWFLVVLLTNATGRLAVTPH